MASPGQVFIWQTFAKKGEVIPYAPYPAWRYHADLEPLIVSDTEADEEAKQKGYDAITSEQMANKVLSNWFWDLEDMSPKQLVTFAQDEFDIDLPIEAGQKKLFRVICDLSRNCPQNKGRVVLMAHVIEMNLKATQEDIRKMQEKEVSEVTRWEVEI